MMGIEAMKEEYHQAMLDRALVNTGNNYRIKRVMTKAATGEKVTLAYLGGSITDDTLPYNIACCYTKLSYHYFKDNYGCNDNVHYVNAGMNGTTSVIGLIRLERDVLQFHPDIVFVEFGVNDSKDELHRDCYESLILRLLHMEEQPVVILLFMQSDGGYSCQGHMQVIGEHYDLPMISIGDAIRPEIIADRMKWTDYSDDSIHPKPEGHRLIGEFIEYYFKKVMLQTPNTEYRIPEKPFYGNDFYNMKLLDSGNTKLERLGSFQPEVTIKEFDKGYSYVRNTGNQSLRLTLSCKNLFVVFMESNDTDAGNAEIYIDGTRKAILSGYRIFAWGNPSVRIIFQEDTVKDHSIEVKMSPGEEMKKFRLLAFGYSD